MSPDIQPGRTVITPLTLEQRNALRLSWFTDTEARIRAGETLSPALLAIHHQRAVDPDHMTIAEREQEKRGRFNESA